MAAGHHSSSELSERRPRSSGCSRRALGDRPRATASASAAKRLSSILVHHEHGNSRSHRAGRGIGRTIAQTLVREGFRIALCARSWDEIVAAAREVDPGGERTLPVAVFAIHPGVVRTPMNEANIQRPEVRRYVPGFCRMVEEGRVVGPERAAALVLTLASGKHRQLSGQYITIDDPLNV